MNEESSGDIIHQQNVIQTKVEYAYGILMEKGDRIIDDDYSKSMIYYKKANKLFLEAKQSSLTILSERYPNFNQWIKNDLYITFEVRDIPDLYWLAASMAGAIQSSRGSNPYELINIPTIGKLLETAIFLDPEWGRGSLFSAMMSYSAIRSDLSRQAMKDTIDFYFNKALQISDSLDASIFVSYAELIHKPRQERNEFEDKLKYAINMDLNKNKKMKLNNLISINRAKWLMSSKEDYFLE
mgnify:FL=1|tara:strand:- start:452 stop:1171 length:720 start_codon:yes stop_codon:yes gene_type:complete